MKAATVGGPSVVSVSDAPGPEPEPGGITVRMRACGICGSDLEKVFGEYGQPSTRLGHEPAGTVEAAGAGVDWLEPGDRVFTHHHVPCYDCRLCRAGSETMCPRYYETNLSPCGLAEVYGVPAWNVAHGGVLRLPDSVSFGEAAMIEPLACCIRAQERMGLEGGTVAVFGAGPTGLLHAALARARGCSQVTCLDTNPFRLGFARDLGLAGTVDANDADRVEQVRRATGGGADAAIVAAGSLGALADALGSVRRGGTVMMFGVPSRGASMNLDVSAMYSGGAALMTSYAASDRDTGAALDMIASGRLDAGRLITHTYPLADSQAAFERARSGEGAMKIVITSGNA